MRAWGVTVVAALLFGCRDAPAPYEVVRPFASDSSGRLTFNVKDDRVPVFGPGSDTVYYLAQSFLPYEPTNGLILAVPRAGGIARPIMESVQVGVATQPWLSAPALSADGKSIAFWQITNARDENWSVVACPGDEPIGTHTPDVEGSESVLQQAVLRVRRLDATQAADDGRLVIDFAGRTIDTTRRPDNLPYVIVNIAYPFHRQWERYRLPVFRASWSPDGSRLVFSDGLQLRLWTMGQATSLILPNTEDGVLPAWSPDGTQIAFTKLVRGPSLRMTCFGLVPGAKDPLAAWFDRTIYTGVTRDNGQLQVIRPDGTGLRALGPGEAPAWTQDNRTLLVRRDDQIYRVDVDGGAATPVAGTEGGYVPALSPDGRWVAFSRRVSPENFDIWVARY